MKTALTSRVAAALGWQASSVMIIAVVQVLLLAVLGRHLHPSDFGLVALSNIFTGFAYLFSDVGIGPALIQTQQLDDEQVKGAFYVSVLLGAVLTALTILVAPVAENFFHAKGLAAVLKWLSLAYLLGAFGTVAKALLERELAFRKLMQLEVARAIVSAAICVPLAIAGFGVWALVASVLVGQAFLSLAMLAVQRHAISPTFNFQRVSTLLSYGGGLTLARFLNQLAQNGDYFVIGRVMGPTALGFYERAFKVMQTPTTMLGSVLDRVLFPAMSEIQHDNERLKRGFSRAISLGYIVQIPVCVAVAVTAPDLTALILGPGWEKSIAPLRVLALSIPLRIMVRLSDSLVRAKGAVYPSAAIKGVFATLVLAASYLGSRWGITGVAAGVLIAVCANYMLMALLSHRLIGASWRQHLRWSAPGLAIGTVTLIVGIPVQYTARAVTASPALRLIIFGGLVGSIVVGVLTARPGLLGFDLALMKRAFTREGNRHLPGPPSETLSIDAPHTLPDSPVV